MSVEVHSKTVKVDGVEVTLVSVDLKTWVMPHMLGMVKPTFENKERAIMNFHPEHREEFKRETHPGDGRDGTNNVGSVFVHRHETRGNAQAGRFRSRRADRPTKRNNW